MLVEFASGRFGQRASVWPGPTPRRGRSEIEVVVRARRSGVLPLDDRKPDARVLRLVSRALEPGNRSRFDEALPTGPTSKSEPLVERTEDPTRVDRCSLPGARVAGIG